MKETPLLFQGDMVRAILDGSKTQTRRVIKPQPIFEGVESFGDSWKWSKGDDWFSGVTYEQLVGRTGLLHGDRCPYKVGNRIWVKETFAYFDDPKIVYRADCLNKRGIEDEDSMRCRKDYGVKWKPSIFMPRSASRITLEIVEVRVQRVQEMSNRDAAQEGVAYDVSKEGGWPLTRFEKLWDSINAKRGYPWSANPWVWALTFKRI